jgi:hypothetical protein
LAVRARILSTDVVAKHARARAAAAATNSDEAAMEVDTDGHHSGVFAMAMSLSSAPAVVSAGDVGKHEIELYVGNISPVSRSFDDPLGWWKVNFLFTLPFKLAHCQTIQGSLPAMSDAAHDVLAIPGVSVSVECMFSSRKTLRDDRSSMTAETASIDIITKVWLKAGLANDVDWRQIINVKRD